MKTSTTVTILATVLMSTCVVNTSNAQGTNTGTNSANNMRSSTMDTAFISKNIRDNVMEVQLSRMGLQRATDSRVKNAARQMVTDHTQILNELAQVGRKYHLNGMDGSNMASGTGSGNMNHGQMNASGRNNGQQGNTSSGGKRQGRNNTSGSGTMGSQNDTGDTGNTGTTGTNSRTGTSGTTGSGTGTGNTSGSGQQMDSAGTSGASGSGSMTGTGSGATMGMGNRGNGMNSGMQMNNMQDTTALAAATGAEFDRLWLSQMLTMHEAKLAELTAAAGTLNDTELKAAVTRAIPKIRMHRDMLSRLSTNNTSTGTGTQQ
jgi:predicted outer membrane protein